MANLLKGRSASHKAAYEGFDLSHSVNFTSSVGHIIPVMYDLLLPDDKVRIKTDILSRLQPMVSASPVPIREFVDYYFVPLECLYSLFPSLLSDTNEDIKSTLFDKSKFSDRFPTCSLYATYNSVVNSFENFEVRDAQGFEPYQFGFARLLDAFHYGFQRNSGFAPFTFNHGNSNPANVFVNTLVFQSYQAVWQFFFRDDKRIEFNRQAFNIDDFYDTLAFGLDGSSVSESAFERYKEMFSIRYRPKRKDPYTIVSPSPLGGLNSVNKFDANSDFSSFVNQWLVNTFDDSRNVPNPRNGDDGSKNSPYTDVSFPSSTYGYDPSSNPVLNGMDSAPGTNVKIQQSLQQHRIAQAIEKLSSIWMQSGKNYHDMISNLFGSKDVQEDWSKPIYIGSNSADIEISPLVAPVSTSDNNGDVLSQAGSVTGSGVANNSKTDTLTFHAKCHGILIGLYSCVPDVIYRTNGIDEFHNYSKRADFPNPVTDELGERPLFDYNFYTPDSIVPGEPNILGWLPRFSELKLKPNRAFGSFGASLAYWLPSEYSGIPTVNSYFYISPKMLNPIMEIQYGSIWDDPQGVPNDLFEEDPLLHFFYINYYKASRMSSFGVPSTYFG